MAAHRKSYDEAVEMYEKGMSIEAVGDFYGVTRQAMWAVLKRRGVAFRQKERYGTDNVFFRGGVRQCPRAKQLLALAVERGEVVPSHSCSECGSTGRIEGHHDDYRKPLPVRWLCHKCHYDWHIQNIPIANQQPTPITPRAEVSRMGGSAAQSKKTKEERDALMENVRSHRRSKKP